MAVISSGADVIARMFREAAMLTQRLLNFKLHGGGSQPATPNIVFIDKQKVMERRFVVFPGLAFLLIFVN